MKIEAAEHDNGENLKRLAALLCVAMSAAWLINKNALLDGLEYTIDIFVNLRRLAVCMRETAFCTITSRAA